MNDSLSASHIESIVNNLQTLRQINEANVAFMEQSKEILAVQWFLGNIAILLVFVIAIIAYRFAGKALHAFAPKYRLPRRWFFTLITCFTVVLLLFNLLPQLIPVNTGLSSETEKVVLQSSVKGYANK